MSALLDEMAMAISRSYAWTQDDFDGVARAAAAVVAKRLRKEMDKSAVHVSHIPDDEEAAVQYADNLDHRLSALLAELETQGEGR